VQQPDTTVIGTSEMPAGN